MSLTAFASAFRLVAVLLLLVVLVANFVGVDLTMRIWAHTAPNGVVASGAAVLQIVLRVIGIAWVALPVGMLMEVVLSHGAVELIAVEFQIGVAIQIIQALDHTGDEAS